MGLIEAILHRPDIIAPETDNSPVGTFLQIINYGLERTLDRDSFLQLEQKMLFHRLRTPPCEELDKATRETLDKRKITSSFWERILVFSSHEECFLPGQLSFAYDKDRRPFVLSLRNVLMNAQDIQILCPLERFNEQSVQATFTIQGEEQKSEPTPNMRLGIGPINKREGILFIITRYHDGHPQISLSVLNLDSNWKELFDDKGKLKTIPADITQTRSQGLSLERPTPSAPKELSFSVINDILREKGLIKPNEKVPPDRIFLPQINYALKDTPRIPIYIVARAEEIDPAKTISVSKATGLYTLTHLKLTLDGIFLRCPKDKITVPHSQEDNTAILLTLNPKAFMPTPSGGFYRAKKGIIAIPFKLPDN